MTIDLEIFSLLGSFWYISSVVFGLFFSLILSIFPFSMFHALFCINDAVMHYHTPRHYIKINQIG